MLVDVGHPEDRARAGERDAFAAEKRTRRFRFEHLDENVREAGHEAAQEERDSADVGHREDEAIAVGGPGVEPEVHAMSARGHGAIGVAGTLWIRGGARRVEDPTDRVSGGSHQGWQRYVSNLWL